MYPFFELDPAPWSNNFDDEEIEEEFLPKKPLLDLEFKLISDFEEKFKQKKIDSDRLLIALKSAASCFFHTNFPNKTFIGEIVIPEIEPGLTSPINQKTCKIYSLDESKLDIVLVIVQYDVPIERCFDFTKILFENINAENVYIFDTLFPVNIISSQHVTIPSLFKLETEKSRQDKSPSDIKYLEPPTLVEGASAAILSYRQVRGLHGNLFVSVEDPILLEIPTLLAFENALSFALNKEVSLSPIEYESTLKKLNTRHLNPLFT